eukprot:9062931-Alexandrium_andersonii.AAC.1
MRFVPAGHRSLPDLRAAANEALLPVALKPPRVQHLCKHGEVLHFVVLWPDLPPQDTPLLGSLPQPEVVGAEGVASNPQGLHSVCGHEHGGVIEHL